MRGAANLEKPARDPPHPSADRDRWRPPEAPSARTYRENALCACQGPRQRTRGARLPHLRPDDAQPLLPPARAIAVCGEAEGALKSQAATWLRRFAARTTRAGTCGVACVQCPRAAPLTVPIVIHPAPAAASPQDERADPCRGSREPRDGADTFERDLMLARPATLQTRIFICYGRGWRPTISHDSDGPDSGNLKRRRCLNRHEKARFVQSFCFLVRLCADLTVTPLPYRDIGRGSPPDTGAILAKGTRPRTRRAVVFLNQAQNEAWQVLLVAARPLGGLGRSSPMGGLLHSPPAPVPVPSPVDTAGLSDWLHPHGHPGALPPLPPLTCAGCSWRP